MVGVGRWVAGPAEKAQRVAGMVQQMVPNHLAIPRNSAFLFSCCWVTVMDNEHCNFPKAASETSVAGRPPHSGASSAVDLDGKLSVD